MVRLTAALLVLLLFCLPSVSAATQQTYVTQPSALGNSKVNGVIDLITEPLLRDYLETLVAYGPRPTGTYACDQAAAYIFDQLSANGLQTRYQNFSMYDGRKIPRLISGQNVEGILPGTAPDRGALVFNAHFDGVAVSPAANDDGSGTAAVLAAAYALSHFSFNTTIRFVLFSGEENGLLGSRTYTREAVLKGDDIILEINADMVGHVETPEGATKMSLSVSEDAGWAAATFDAVNTEYLGFTISKRNISRPPRSLGGSDYAPFVNYGWESIACWESEFDSNFHSPGDDLSNVNFSYLVNMTRLIAGTLAALADMPTPLQVRITSPLTGTMMAEGRLVGPLDDETKTICFNDIWIWADVRHISEDIIRVEFYKDGRLTAVDTEAPYKWHFDARSLWTHRIDVVAYDAAGRTSSDSRSILVVNLFRFR